MASDSTARSLDSKDLKNSRIELDGLEKVFTDNHDELFAKGLSIKQAVFYYGDTRKALKSKVEDGTVPAIRLPETHGSKWRVFPDGVPPQLEHLIPKKLRPKKAKQKSEEVLEQAALELVSSEHEQVYADIPEAIYEDGVASFSSYSVDFELQVPQAELEASSPDFSAATEAADLSAETEAADEVQLEQQINNNEASVEIQIAQAVTNSEATEEIQVEQEANNAELAQEVQLLEQVIENTIEQEAGSSSAPEVEPALPSEEFSNDSNVQLIDFSPEIEQVIDFSPEPSQPLIDFSPVQDNLKSDLTFSFAIKDPAHTLNFSTGAVNDFKAAELPEVQPAAPETSKKSTARYAQLQDRIAALEKQLADAQYRSAYLETRLSGLEDQIKFLTASHYQSRSFNKLLFVIPGLVLLAAIVLRLVG